MYILPNGETATNYLHTTVRTKFNDGKWYKGIVRNIRGPEPDEGPNAELYFEVIYKDNDVVDYTFAELLSDILVCSRVSALAAASLDATQQLERQRTLFSEDAEQHLQIPQNDCSPAIPST